MLWRERLLGLLLIVKVVVFVYMHSYMCMYVYCYLLFTWMYVSMCTQRFHKHEIMLLLRNKVMLLVNKAGMTLEIHVQTVAKKFQLLVFINSPIQCCYKMCTVVNNVIKDHKLLCQSYCNHV